MKKVLSFMLVAGLVAMFACGPSAEEKAAREQAIKDSIANDSISKVQIADSIAKAEVHAKFVADSARIADSIANLKKGKK